MRHFFISIITLISLFLISCSDKGTGTEEPTTYSINVTVSPPNSGTISPNTRNTAEDGEELVLQAIPNDEYIFSGWTGDINSSNNPHSIIASKDVEVTANFELKRYELSVGLVGEGTVSEEIVQQKSTDYDHGTLVELTATPAEGYEFIEWQGDLSGSENPSQITIDKPKNVTAVFELKTYALDVSTVGEGTVSEEIVQQKSTDYDHGTLVELTATSAEGYEFIEWQGDLSGNENPSQITIDKPKNVTAVFELETYILSTSVTGQGIVSYNPIKSGFTFGESVEIIAEPDIGWEFVEWQGDVTGNENPITITFDGNKEIDAVFQRKTYSLLATSQGEGTISKNPNQTEYQYESEVELTANPSVGWKFVEWTGDISGNENPISIVIDTTKEVGAIFEKQNYTIQLATSSDGTIAVTPQKDSFEYNEQVEVQATPSDNLEFIRWSNDISGNENPKTITIQGNITVGAVFSSIEDALLYIRSGGVYIAGRVHSASVQLINTLPKDVNLVRLTLKNTNDNVIVENTEGHIIESNTGINFTISFGIQPTIEDFDQYTMEWEVVYNGQNIVKTNVVGNPDYQYKLKQQIIDSIELKVD